MKEKTCYECHIAQPLTEFFKHRGMRDGHINKCKKCSRVESRRYYSHRKEYYKKYARLPRTVEAKKRYAKSEAGRAGQKRKLADYFKRYPAKAAARDKYREAIKSGRLKRQPCEICGTIPAEGHHDDYARPLDVRWLYRSHHLDWHKHNKAKYPVFEEIKNAQR